jgi:hypothetical protein
MVVFLFLEEALAESLDLGWEAQSDSMAVFSKNLSRV